MKRTRMELWLLLAAWATRRALELAIRIGDTDSVRRIHDSTEAQIR